MNPADTSSAKNLLGGFMQSSFQGGMNMISADTQIAEDGYIWLVNARQRFGYIEPTKRNVLLNSPKGLHQGLASVGNVLILFVSGKAYYRIDGSAVWIQIPDFQLSATEPILWSESVPASTFHFVRKKNTSGNIKDPLIVTTDFKVAGTPAALVVQDGQHQPWIIEYDATNKSFSSRLTKNFSQWKNTSISANDREYVPIGRQMMYKDGILHIVAKDKKSVLRSITGRPLDFMINVDTRGNKLATEDLGGAATVSYAADFDEITCLKALDIQGGFLYATKKNTRIVVADYVNTIFDEPTFATAGQLIGTGVVNQYSFSESLNDYVFISSDGAKSFNAVQQLKFKGNSSIFSKNLSRLLYNTTTKKPVKQRDCSCIGFQNFVLFNLDTLWGNLIAVYDVLLENWVSLDITTAFRIKQFALVETDSEIKIYCVTKFNEVYQLYGSNTSEVAELRVRGYTPPQTNIEHKSVNLRPFFNGGTFDGQVFLTEYVDDQLSTDAPLNTDYRYVQELKASLAGIPFPVIPPVLPNNKQRVDNPGFSLTRGLAGKKISFILQWTNDAQLVELMLTTSEQLGATSIKQREITYATNS